MIFKTVDLFSGIGGMRLGFDRACMSIGVQQSCVFSSDINKHACTVYQNQFGEKSNPLCDITKVNPDDIPDFDLMMAGFPCQAFSPVGHKKGFDDIRGTLFFNVVEVLRVKKPKAVLLENVKGLTYHNKGQTFKRIIEVLNDIGYSEHIGVLNSKNFGVPQNRPRVYIVAFLKDKLGGSFSFPQATNRTKRLFDILSDSVDPKYYLSQKYWDTLVKHRQHQEAKGNGFGYVVKKVSDVSSTVLCGGMGEERNLICDESPRILPDWVNTERIRKMTPLEWERLQGFPDGWTDGVPDTARMDLLGNSVTVNVIEAISLNIIKELMSPKKEMCSIFG